MADPRDLDIAIVGVGCRLPGGVRDPLGARDLFLSGRDVVGPVPSARFTLPATTRSGKVVPAAGAFLDGVDEFDAALFGVSAREAAGMDPQQRLLLQCAWAALEDAGVRPDHLDGSRTGTFVGLGLVDWARRTIWSGDPERLDAWAGTGTFDAVAAGRVAYTFGLRGPAMALHTACSASHVAVHQAVRSLRSGEVDLALAGGVQLDLEPEPTVVFAELGALSPSHRCRTFDADADGYVRGEGAGLFALMRLRDAVERGMRVYASIVGSAVDHDGRTNGLTAPSPRAQAEVIRAALDDARRRAGDVGFVEAHGTGTPLGDPVEIEALADVFGGGDRPLHVSSAKTVLGHLEAAAGVAGVLRAIAALSTRSLPPHLHLRRPNPRLPVHGTRIALGAAGSWAGDVAGCSGFGLSGTNAHLVLAAAPDPAPRPLSWPVLAAVSAADEAALAERVDQVRVDPERLVVGASAGRAALRHRAAKVLAGPSDADGDWQTAKVGSRAPTVALVYPPGPEPELWRWLVHFPAAAASVARFDAARAELGLGPIADVDGAAAAFVAAVGVAAACGVALEGAVGPAWAGALASGRIDLVTAARASEVDAGDDTFPSASAAEEAGVDVVAHLTGAPEDVAATLAGWFLRGVDVDPAGVLDGARADVPVYPFRRDRHWTDAVDRAVEVRADFVIREVPAARGVGRSVRGDAFDAGVAACTRWTAPRPTVALVDPACPEDRAVAALAAVAPDVDAVRVDAAGVATAFEVDPEPVVVPGRALDPERPVLVLGGTGHLGRAVIAALAERGARTFDVWSRTAPAAPWPPGLAVRHVAVDLAGPLPPIVGFQGAVHAAGDTTSARATREGAVAALDTALRGPGEFLVVVGSVAAHWGSPGLDAYAGAHRAAEAVMARRTADGHAGAVIVAGPVSGGGLVSADELAAFARAGVAPVPAARVAEVVAAAAAWVGPPLGVAAVEWTRLVPLAERTGPRASLARVRPRRGAAAPARGDLDAVLAVTAAVLGRRPGDLDPDQGFFAAGLDSLLAVQLARDLAAALGRVVVDTVVFDHPTPRALAASLAGPAAPRIASVAASAEPIAVVGYALRFPGAADPDALWDLLASGRDPLGPVPPERWDGADWPEAPREGGFVDAAWFDGAPFGIGDAEAAAMDPQQRLLLEVGREALDRAGIGWDTLVGRRGSVYVGVGRSEYWDRVRDPDADGYVFSGTGNEGSFAAGRLAHWLGLRGEAMAVNTACSSSLVAVHLAVRSLRAGESELALAAGVNVLTSPEAGTVLRRMGALSPTDRCRTFDADADGYVRSEGCGVVVLMRVSEARRRGLRVHAVIEGSAVGHDGRSPGLGVPSGAAQEDVLLRALDDAGRSPDDLDGVAVHGTGTPLGDPVEVGALARVHAGRERPLVLSASKSRLGHLETAAGVAALITVVAAMQRGAWFPNGHLKTQNPRLPAGPWALPAAVTPWAAGSSGVRRAGVSSFGLSGTDAHLILAEGDPPPAAVDAGLRLAAGPTEAHAVAASAVADHVPTALAWHGRGRVGPWRAAWRDGAPEVVRAKPGARVGFVCPGQGAQVPGMGRVLRAAGVPLDALLAPHPWLADVLDADDARIDDTRFTQPALVAVALALGAWCRALGVDPVAFVGHSVGELAAAALAGHLDPAEALAFAIERGRVIGDLPRDGGMAALQAPESAVRGLLGDGVSVAAVNADDEVVVSGGEAALDAFLARAAAFAPRRLRTSHAFHGPPMDAVVLPTGPTWRDVPGSGFRSALSGSDPRDPDHWARHVREPVAFARALRAAPPVDVWLELGPRAVASGLIERVLGADAVPLLPHVLATDPALGAARAWAHGVDLDLGPVVGPLRVVDAPPTPLLRRRAWVDPARRATEALPCSRVTWVPATPGGAVAGGVVDVASVDDVLRFARALPPGPVALRATGVFHGTDPHRAAIGGAFASLLAEHPDRDLRLFDGVPDDGLEAAWRAGSPRVAWDGGPRVPTMQSAPASAPTPVRGTWLVSGGDGALGRAVVAYLEARGAKAEVVSRGRGVDVTDVAAVGALIAQIRDRGEEVGGVFHAAGVARGALAHTETADGVAAVWAAKVDGARVLSDAVGDAVPFVVASSAVAYLGLEGQAAYGAANAGLEALIRARRARGGSGTALALGPLTGGMADAVDWAGRGVRRADPARAAVLLGALPADAVVFPVVWAEVASDAPTPPAGELLPRVLDVVAAVLGREVDADTGFADAGADSLTAVELSRRLSKLAGRRLPATLVFEHPTPRAVARHLAGDVVVDAPAARRVDPAEPIAIVGYAVRFPGAPDADALWDLLAAGRVSVGPIPPDRWDADEQFAPFPGTPGRSYVREGGFLPDVEAFDPDAFGMSPREATSLDPQQRLLLELSREALEDAGHHGRDLPGSRTAVYVGIADRGWLHAHHAPGAPLYPDGWAGTGNEPSFAAGRVAFTFGLRGEALALNTTCSSTLVAVDHAVRALRGGTADRALAAGVAMMFLPDDTAYLCAMQALSPTHRCHTFDARADGYARSEGGGVFVLTRLSDAVARGDRVLAVIRGTAVNHDGASSGLTVPNGAAQEDVLRRALADAGVAPAEVAYLEAHGTGTRLGDPIETRAVSAVYGADRSAPLLVGAVKANLGHAELAAGAASLAKVLSIARHRVVPGHPDLRELNPELELSGVEIVGPARPWPTGARFAAISGFGLSGTNAHLVLELPEPAAPTSAEGPAPLLVSAPSEAAARAAAARIASMDLAPATVAAELALRAPERYRVARLTARDLADAPVVAARRRPTIVFLASGQGSQSPGMGLGLDRFPAFREALDHCAAVLDPLLGRPLRALLADPAAVDRTEYTQPLLFATSWATAALLRSVGVVPDVVAGHSLGEFVAAALAGVWSLDDALQLVVERGRLMASLARPGSMAAVAASADVVRPLLRPGAELAAFNAPEEVVVAGEADAVAETLAALPAGTRSTTLPVSRPFHTACVDPMLDPFEAVVARVPARSPSTRIVSLATGRLESEAFTSARFWRDHARRPVLAADAARTLGELGPAVFVDLGPAPVLSSLVRRNLGSPTTVPTGRREVDAAEVFAQALVDLFLQGVDVDVTAVVPGPRVRLPPTPFDRRPYALPRVDAVAPEPAYEVVWEPVDAVGPLPARVRVLGDRDGFGAALAAAGVQLADDAAVTVDLRLRDADVGPAGLRALAEIGGERWVVALRPDGWAWRAAARSARLERAPTRVDVVRADTPGDLVTALRADLDDVVCEAGEVRGPRLSPLALPQAPPIRGAWLVTGGTGALGMRFAAWLAARGAERLVVCARTPLAADDPRRAALDALGCPVHVAAVDAGDADALRLLLALHPVAGAVHAAGVSRPQPLDALDDATVAATLGGKVAGADALDAALPPDAALVLVGSIAAVWGSRDLAAYAAANGHLEAVARRRRARGGPAVCLHFGPWGGGGMVDEDRARGLGRAGLSLLAPKGALFTVGALLGGPVSAVVARVDFARLAPSLEIGGPQSLFRGLVAAPSAAVPTAAADAQEPVPARILRHARAVLGHAALKADEPMADRGFDSLMATELKQRLLADGVDLPLGRILSGPSVDEMVDMAGARVAEPEAPAAAAATPADGPDRLWFWTHLAAVIVGIALASGVWAVFR